MLGNAWLFQWIKHKKYSLLERRYCAFGRCIFRIIYRPNKWSHFQQVLFSRTFSLWDAPFQQIFFSTKLKLCLWFWLLIVIHPMIRLYCCYYCRRYFKMHQSWALSQSKINATLVLLFNVIVLRSLFLIKWNELKLKYFFFGSVYHKTNEEEE